MDRARLAALRVWAYAALYAYAALFGAALGFSAFYRAISSFYFDTLTEAAVCVVGLLIFIAAVRTAVRAVRTGKVPHGRRDDHVLLAAAALTATIYLAGTAGWLQHVPSLMLLVLTAGVQMATFFTREVSSVLVGRFGLGLADPAFAPMLVLLQVAYWNFLIRWFWPHSAPGAKKKAKGKARRKG